jgi:F-type H+-transporting ATPase subunit delta
MSDVIVAKRYARALFEVAKERGIISQVQQELKAVVEVVKANADFRNLLNHPNIDASAKADFLNNVFANKLSEPVFGTLHLLVKKGRQNLLNVVYSDFVTIANEKTGQALAVVTSAFALSQEEQAHIAAEFGKITGKTIQVETVTNKALIGGIQVRIGDRLYDGSLAGKLDRMKKSLSQVQAL